MPKRESERERFTKLRVVLHCAWFKPSSITPPKRGTPVQTMHTSRKHRTLRTLLGVQNSSFGDQPGWHYGRFWWLGCNLKITVPSKHRSQGKAHQKENSCSRCNHFEGPCLLAALAALYIHGKQASPSVSPNVTMASASSSPKKPLLGWFQIQLAESRKPRFAGLLAHAKGIGPSSLALSIRGFNGAKQT